MMRMKKAEVKLQDVFFIKETPPMQSPIKSIELIDLDSPEFQEFPFPTDNPLSSLRSAQKINDKLADDFKIDMDFLLWLQRNPQFWIVELMDSPTKFIIKKADLVMIETEQKPIFFKVHETLNNPQVN